MDLHQLHYRYQSISYCLGGILFAKFYVLTKWLKIALTTETCCLPVAEILQNIFLSLIFRIFDFLWYSPAENTPQKRQLSKKLIKKDRDYLKEKLLTNKYSGRNISHHFWQGGTANDALLTGLELNIVDCSKTSHRGALLCNDRNLHGHVECIILGKFVYRKQINQEQNCAND